MQYQVMSKYRNTSQVRTSKEFLPLFCQVFRWEETSQKEGAQQYIWGHISVTILTIISGMFVYLESRQNKADHCNYMNTLIIVLTVFFYFSSLLQSSIKTRPASCSFSFNEDKHIWFYLVTILPFTVILWLAGVCTEFISVWSLV